MTRIRKLATLTAAALVAATLQAEAAGRVALVIGNSSYEATTPLANPKNDATAIGEALQGLGFEVVTALDADRRATISAIDDFSRLSVGADVAIFFFAGHGIQIGGQNFLLPIDVEADSERALRYSAIDAQEVIAEMERNANVSIAILDACRDNPLVDEISRTGGTRSASVSRGLGRMQLTGRGALVAFAAAAGDTAADGRGDHSPYTEALLEEIAEPNVEVGLMFRRVSRRVRDATRGDQQPELLVRLVDEVYLNPQQAVVAPAIPETVAVSEEASDVVTVEPPPVEVAAVSDLDAEEISRAADALYFGERVIHRPDWYGSVSAPEPTGWRSNAPTETVEADENNSYGTAQYVPVASHVEARQFPRGDYDWFAVDVPSAGEILVEVDQAPEPVDLWVRAWNADHKVAADWQGAPRPGGALYARLAVPKAGRYWLEMTDGSRDAESETPYRTLIDFLPADDTLEPNNTFGSAWSIPVDSRFEASMFPRGDVDWYKVWVGEPGLLTGLITDVPKDLDMFMRVWNLDGKVTTDWAGPPRAGGDTFLEAPLAQPGTYIIEVKDGSSDAASVDLYRMEFEFIPVPDFAEPNDTFGTAHRVEHTGNYQLAVFPRGDVDWLAIDVPHPGELTLEATRLDKDIDLYMRVWNADKAVVRDWIGPARQGGDVYDFADLPEPGRYYIEIKDGSSDASSPDLFDLDLTYIAQADQYEPNNGIATASPLTTGRTVPFNMLPKGDVDWFRVRVDHPGELAITIDESPEDLDLHYRVWNEDRKVVRDWVAPYRKGGLTEGFADLPSAGVYYIEVKDGSSDERSIDHATLTTAFTPVADAYEPNNGYGSPAPLPFGTPVYTNILPRGDADWYTLEAPREGTFVVTIDQVDEDLDVYVRLWDGEVRAGSWFGPPKPGGVTEAEIAVPGPGVYRLEVKDGSDDARSAVPFRMNVAFR